MKVKLSDIKLTEEELAEIEVKIEEYNQHVYKGNMPAHNKQTMRRALIAAEKFALWEAQDYVYGQDEGEAPKGAQW